MTVRTAVASGEDGFTLLELVVAMLLISIAVAGLIGVLGTSFRSTAVDIHRTDATAIAAQAMSELEAGSFISPATVTRAQQRYTVTGTATPTTATNGTTDAYPTYAVTVAWQDQAGSHSVTQSTASYPAVPTSSTPCPVLTGVTPAATSPATGEPAVDVSWSEPTGGGVTQWQVQISSGGGAWTTAADEAPDPGQPHQVEIGGLAPGQAYEAQVLAVTGCGSQVFGPTAPVTTSTLAATGCTAGSVTLGPAVVARDATYETLGDVSVVVTTAGSCPLGLWAGVLTTSDPSGPAVTAALAQSAPGTYTGTLFDPIQPWDLGIHTVEVFSGAPVTPLPSSPTATAVLCVTSGASTC